MISNRRARLAALILYVCLLIASPAFAIETPIFEFGGGDCADCIQSEDMNTLSELDTQIGLTGTANSTTFLRGDGAWTDIVNTLAEWTTFLGITGTANSSSFLRGDGTWTNLVQLYDTAAEAAASGLQFVVSPDTPCTTGQQFLADTDGIKTVCDTPLTSLLSLDDLDVPTALLWTIDVSTTFNGDPNGDIACDANELYRKEVVDTSTSPERFWRCTGTGTTGTAVWTQSF
jgi:hypothetical protein